MTVHCKRSPASEPGIKGCITAIFYRPCDQKDAKWSVGDLETLVGLKMEGESWDAISKQIQGHHADNCRSDWSHRDDNRKKSGAGSAWSEAEDRSLVALFTEGQDWKTISGRVGRSIGACIIHLEDYSPNLSAESHWPWTHDEDRLLVALRYEGMDFEIMHPYFTDRTVLPCRTR